MQFREFEQRVRNLPAFNLNDIRKFAPGFHRQQLSYWQNQNLIRPLTAGYYLLSDREMNESILWMMANRIYEPSYISLESALAHYGVIPESVLGATSISARKTQQFESPWGMLTYRSIRPELMFGYQVIETSHGWKYKIARLEKAVLDYLYLSRIQSIDDFEALRWNQSPLLVLQNNPIFDQYTKVFHKKTLENRVELLMGYLHD
ncbi:MAG: hypothetical protein HPY85_15100 [Anaerolineae bacterium]|nr:hypothetical protein [Anaerolineae bacterium]